MGKKQSQRGVSASFVLIVVALLGLIAGGGYVLWRTSQSDQQPETPQEVTPTPREIGKIKLKEPETSAPPESSRPIPTGLQIYRLSGKFNGPTIASISFDPLDAKAGQIQKITVKALDKNPIISVQAIVKVGAKRNTLDLKLIEGIQTEGTWEGTSIFPDSDINQLYEIETIAKSATGTTSVPLSWR